LKEVVVLSFIALAVAAASPASTAHVVGDQTAAPPAKFDFKHFESLPSAEKVPQANAAAIAMFPPGTTVEAFKQHLAVAGAKCVFERDYLGPALACVYRVKALSLVSTDWVVVGRTDEAGSKVLEVSVARNLTGL
jgi:hypothetical protein